MKKPAIAAASGLLGCILGVSGLLAWQYLKGPESAEECFLSQLDQVDGQYAQKVLMNHCSKLFAPIALRQLVEARQLIASAARTPLEEGRGPWSAYKSEPIHWRDVTAQEAFKRLSQARREHVRQVYFDDIVRPKVSLLDVAAARKQFDRETASSIFD